MGERAKGNSGPQHAAGSRSKSAKPLRFYKLLNFMAGRMDGAVLATIWSLILLSLPRWHQAFEFFKPVEDDVDLGFLLLFLLDHQKALSVWGDVIIGAIPNAWSVLSFENRLRYSYPELRLSLNANGHHLVTVSIEKLLVSRPHWLRTALGRDLPFATRTQVRPHVDLVPT